MVFAGSSGFCFAESLEGTKNIVLSSQAGEHHTIGKVIFHSVGNNKTSFQIEMGESMKDNFIAMRPFRCLTGEKQQLCWFPVYNEPPQISPNDLVPLEQALMFIKTKPHALSVDGFNGLYYKLRWTKEGIRGTLFEVDMAPFIAPDILPVEQRARPLQAQDFFEAPPGSNWLTEISIE